MILQRAVMEFLEHLALELVDRYDDKLIEWFKRRVDELHKEKKEKETEKQP